MRQGPIFIGLKVDGPLRRSLESVSGPDRKYVSSEDTTFLTLCKLGEDQYVGKVVVEALGTDRVDDVRRNVLSILQRLCPDVRISGSVEIFTCTSPSPASRE